MSPRFVFVVCQCGAESICKSEILDHHPELKFSFSRPGFLTFRVDEGLAGDRFHLKSTLARTYGWSMANSKSDDLEQQLDFVCQYPDLIRKCQHLHVWERDRRVPGSSGFEPGRSELARQISKEIQQRIQNQISHQLVVNRVAKADDCVLDIVLIEPDYWFVGHHIVGTRFQRWPGGTPLADNFDAPISRAYFKIKEALLWSGIQIQEDEVCAEIGSSPGGACQYLLEKKAKVIAIDPADLDESIQSHENLTHFKCRGKDVRKKDLKDVRWLFVDTNVAPNYTLETVEQIVTNQHVNRIRGLILTLKISDWKLVNEIPAWKTRIKKLGFQWIKTRQLAFNRKEICLVAVKDRFAVRSSKRRTAPKRSE